MTVANFLLSALVLLAFRSALEIRETHLWVEFRKIAWESFHQNHCEQSTHLRRSEASLVEFLDAQRAFNDATQAYNDARASFTRSLYLIKTVCGATVSGN